MDLNIWNKRIAVIAIAGAVVSGQSAAVDAADRGAEIRGIVDAAIKPVMAEHDVPGMAVAVSVDGQAYFFNYGVASRETRAPVSEATLFELGSVSKTFTATLAAQALDEGKLALDDHPSRYMPQLKGAAIDKASLLNLGTYTAGGLPLQFPDSLQDAAAMPAYFRQWLPDAAPGKQRRYSNPSIGLLGHITGLALQGEFAALLETRLFPQLGLRHSYVHVPDSAQASYAWGYNKANQPVRVNPGIFDAEAYGVKSTSADMLRFVQANLDPARLEAPLRRAVEGTHTGYFAVGDLVQGLGWEHYAYPITLQRLQAGNAIAMDARPATQLSPPQTPPAATLYNKTGATGGFGSYVLFVPSQRIGIVMLANRNYPNPARIAAAYSILAQLAK
jgi:beta-lactamase class C